MALEPWGFRSIVELGSIRRKGSIVFREGSGEEFRGQKFWHVGRLHAHEGTFGGLGKDVKLSEKQQEKCHDFEE